MKRSKNPLSLKVQEQIKKFAASRSETPEQSELFWLCSPDGDHGPEDYCADCAPIISALVPLVFFHLALLRGETIQPAVHVFTEEDGSHSHRCVICDTWEDNASLLPCWNGPRRAVEWAKAAVDGGWTGESDSWRTCENCGKDLYVNLTDEGVEEELKHWREYGPPDCGKSWWEFSEMIDSLTRDTDDWRIIKALFEKWGLLLAADDQSAEVTT